MTAPLDRRVSTDAGRRPFDRRRRWWGLAVVATVAWSVWRAGLDFTSAVNEQGWGQVREFFTAMYSPDLSSSMVELAIREVGVTIGYALLGTTLALIIGSVGGVLLTQRIWTSQSGELKRGRIAWIATRVAFTIPRSMHEVVFGLFLVNILGIDPLVAILAIGIPFGAVTAKVFAELLDDVSHDAELALRASGAGRVSAFLVGTVPQAFGDLLSYAFYRFECALRSAAVLGIIGAGGIGFQLALSFQSLRYDEMWTLLWTLIIISGLVDRWSSSVRNRNALAAETHMEAERTGARRPRTDRLLRLSAVVATLAIPIAWWRLGVDMSNLWNERTRELTAELIRDSTPPEIGAGGLTELIDDSLETIALAVIAATIAFGVASPIAFLAHRSRSARPGPTAIARQGASLVLRFALLIARSVPPPVWGFVVVFVLFPGLWPAAVALAIYNIGVLGRLQGEVLENHDDRPARLVRATGATSSSALAVATVPVVAGRFAMLGLYRWEVIIRETVIVGVVGAAGLGRRLDEQTAAFNYDGVVATVLSLFVVTAIVDLAAASIRRALR